MWCFKRKQEAEAAAGKLARELDGKGWKPSVWNNMGWHAKVENKSIRMHVHPDGGYACFLSDTKNGTGGSSLWHLRNNVGEDPNKIIRLQLAEAKKVIKSLVDNFRETAEACNFECEV